MRVLVTGASGLIGSALVRALKDDGHETVRLVRRSPTAGDEVRWDPAAGTVDRAGLAGIEGAVHLAGEGIGVKRWTAEQKRRILDGRVKGTTLLAETLAALDPRPRVLVSGSAVGYYGIRGDEVLTEGSTRGRGFLADVTDQWEAAAAPATRAGIRTVLLRTGIVLSARGGALAPLLRLFRFGLGGRLGPGTQWWSWIALADEVGVIRHALTHDAVRGPVNATSPNPATNAEVTAALGAVLHRPTLVPAPTFAMSLVLGRGLTEEVVLAGQRALPTVAQATGYHFRHPDLHDALRAILTPS